ncbi:MAG: hypothetical protein HYV62_00130 [Candidatus Rokubacteria bacterium]|nr:hypothetical protein [Candidatus Rokubacteria bacterium]
MGDAPGPFGTHHGPGPGYFPLLLAALLALLAVSIVARGGAVLRLASTAAHRDSGHQPLKG